MKNHKKTKPISPRQAAQNVIKQLRRQGYQALLAGGCVRDMLLGHLPKDYDVATNATPDTVAEMFPRTLTIGAQFGVVVVLNGSRQIEVATFRSDLSYSDGRRPDKIVYTDARTDAERRDFTINGMFYDPIDKKVIDYVAGQKDLKKQVIRAIGDPIARFNEDHLRMLRAIRFACRLNFSIEPATWKAIIKLAPKIKRVSPERISGELENILVDP
ncbi:MAG: CCA tRNA nucleotidyltransferase, partial [Planctomycetes bacterium]|nr:CCA tRNA nucleotidyltransferase [Planctomycetota bacterium]